MPNNQGTFSNAPSPPSRILVVEDDFLLATMMQEALRTVGFDVIGLAVDTEQAIALASQKIPDLAIMDVRLAHGDDGIDAAIALLQRFAVHSIFVTAHADDQTRARGASAQPLGWLIKPYRLDDFLRRISNALVALESSWEAS
jgi:DNA-binding response OmpR family regulator